MKITFLGTGTSQGVPVITCNCEVCRSPDPRDVRLRTSALISVGYKNFVIDVGPDFRQQMLQNNIVDIESVLISHEHNDHIIGLDDLRPFNFRYRKNMPIHCTSQVAASLKERFAYAFSDNPYPGAPRFEVKEIIANQEFISSGQKIIPFEVMHGKMPVMGFRFGDLTYITDAKNIEDTAIEKIKGTKLLVVNALRHEEHHSHFNLEEALAFINKVNPEKTYLTHISHKMGAAATINKELPPNVSLAYDGLVLSV